MATKNQAEPSTANAIFSSDEPFTAPEPMVANNESVRRQ